MEVLVAAEHVRSNCEAAAPWRELARSCFGGDPMNLGWASSGSTVFVNVRFSQFQSIWPGSTRFVAAGNEIAMLHD